MAIFSGDVLEDARRIIARYPDQRSAMMPLLYLAQSEGGWITPDAMREIGELLDVTTAEVGAVASFYTMFRMEPTGKYMVTVCTNISCKLRGADRVFECARAEVGPSGMTEDGLLSLDEEECLGACEHAPVVQVNWANYEEIDVAGMRSLLDALRREEPPAPARGDAPRDLKAASRMLAGLDGELA